MHLHFDRQERRVFDLHVNLLSGRNKVRTPVDIFAQHASKQLDEPLPPDGAIAIDPGPVAADLQPDVAAVGRIPALNGWRLTIAHIV